MCITLPEPGSSSVQVPVRVAHLGGPCRRLPPHPSGSWQLGWGWGSSGGGQTRIVGQWGAGKRQVDKRWSPQELVMDSMRKVREKE